MDKEELINKVMIAVRDSSIKGFEKKLSKPSGRSPNLSSLELSSWYNDLDEYSKKMISKITTKAVDESIFGFLCVFDGVRSVKDKPGDDHFSLHYTLDGDSFDLTNDNEDFLHDIYHSTCMSHS